MARETRTQEEEAHAARLGELLQKCRLNSGISVPQLAERLGVTTARVYQLESGKYSPSLFQYTKALEACGFSILLPDPDAQLTTTEPTPNNAALIRLIDERIAAALAGRQT